MSRTAGPDRVVVINDDALEQGGAATIALAGARMVAERGTPVAFLSGRDEIEPDLARRGIATAVLGGRRLLERGRWSAAARGLYDPTINAAVARWIDENDSPRTVYHLHNWHKVLSPSVFPALSRVAPRLLISAHDFFLACPNGAYFHYPRQRECDLRPNSLGCAATSCDRRHYAHKLWRALRHEMRHRLFDLTISQAEIVAVHEAMLPLLARGPIAPSRVRVLRNPVTPWHTTRVTAEKNEDIFFIGRLDGDKGAHLLARAAHHLGARVKLIGDGPLRAEIAHICPGAEFLGWRSRDEIAELVSSARIVVSPTLNREPFGLVALEALMSGIPIVVAQSSPFADQIVDRQLGLACNPHNDRALAGAIATLLRDDLLVRRMSCRAFAEARGLAPTPSQWCDRLLNLYAARLGEPATASLELAKATAGGDG
jgi:glycosyltransferase involved in cell wall biosynthesis